MKKELSIFLILLVFFIFHNNTVLNSYPFGSPGNKTGSIGDGGQNCTGCHYGSNIGVAGSISSNFLNNTYIPGNTYTLTLNAPSNYPNYGFEITAEDPNTGANKGIFVITDNINTKIIQSIFLILLVIFVATCVKIVGILLITSMLIIPAATSRQITRSPGKMAIVSGMLGIISILFGVYLSVIVDIPTGPSIILVLTVIFVLVLSLFKKN